MGAPDVLSHLHQIGATVRPLPGGKLEVLHDGRLTGNDLEAIRACKSELLKLLTVPPPSPGRALVVAPQVRALLGLDDAEIERMASRHRMIQTHGYTLDDAEVIADRLLLRDRTKLDMHVCLECSNLSGRRCLAARQLGAAPAWTPIRHELQRCPAFEAKELNP